MATRNNPFYTLRTFNNGTAPGSKEPGARSYYYSVPALKEAGFENIARLPQSIRIVLEALLRNCDGKKVTEQDIRNLASWNATTPGDFEIPFTVARVILQDFTGVPLLVDLAAMRTAVRKLGKDPKIIEPLVPVDLVVDHSVQVDFAGTDDALQKNLELEFHRNRERYQFLKWGMQAFDTFKVVPPGIGIVHQVNLEHLARGVFTKGDVCYPDTLVGTDSHTTMINGLGIVGWGVGGIEAEAAMLGQPVTFLVPEVVGVYLSGDLRPGTTATDLVLHVTELLRNTKVVGKFVEFFGPGAAALSVPDRATLANMAPEYGATMGFFGVDSATIAYLRDTGRDETLCRRVENYFKAQQLWGIPLAPGEIRYTQTVALDLGTIRPCVSGPRRPQDRIELDALQPRWQTWLAGNTPAAAPPNPTIQHGSVLIAAITSCTNTSNPAVMIAAGLLAKKANAYGIHPPAYVKTSLGPGSRVVTAYLEKTGLQEELAQLGFQTVGYGCTTCIGNSGPLLPAIEDAVRRDNTVAAAVLSGNRNFEARVHPSIKANFLASPPLVIAFALAGTVDIDFNRDPVGISPRGDGTFIYLRDIWPTNAEIASTLRKALSPDLFKKFYTDFTAQNPKWNEIPTATGNTYAWDAASTYIQEPPFFQQFTTVPGTPAEIRGARPLGLFGDSITTDHISPAGSIKKDSPAGRYLSEHAVSPADFNSYGSRRGNDRVMTRGTFANVRIKNLLVPGVEGGVTQYYENNTPTLLPIYDAAAKYRATGIPLIVIGGEDYGMGSSRDWAAKGTALLGVKAVVTKSFERIHRSNLVGMGVLPLNFKNKSDYDRVHAHPGATFDILGIADTIRPRQDATLRVHPADGTPAFDIPLVVRIDTPVEVDYYLSGGILPYVLAQILKGARK